jgi:hypothetical protein
VALHGGDKRAARFVAFGGNAPVSVERKLGINGHQFFIAQKNHRVRSFAA